MVLNWDNLGTRFQHAAARRRLDFVAILPYGVDGDGFNTQPPEGGWNILACDKMGKPVSTRSRPKAAGPFIPSVNNFFPVSTRSRPKAAGMPGKP